MRIIDQQSGQRELDPSGQVDGTGTLAEDEFLDWDDESEFVSARPAWMRIVRAVLAIVILTVIGVVIYSTGRSWFAGQLDPEGEPGEAIEILVPAGSTTGQIASILESNEVIPNSTFFRYYVEWKEEGNFQAGEYTMQANMSADEAIARLTEGPRQIEYGEFLIREGLWISEITEEVSEQIPGITAAQLQEVLDLNQLEPRYRPADNDSWEGLLFPNTYGFEEGIEPTEVIQIMSDEFADVTGELGYGTAERVHNLSAYEVIIIASLVEAEAKTDQDRPKIARVIHNRLRDGERLDIDATLIYAAGERGIPPTQEQLDTPGPFNTRHSESLGLPPTPIAAPGRLSLEAAMNPVEGPWKYYVRIDEEGNHAFAETLEEHNINKQQADESGFLDG